MPIHFEPKNLPEEAPEDTLRDSFYVFIVSLRPPQVNYMIMGSLDYTIIVSSRDFSWT